MIMDIKSKIDDMNLQEIFAACVYNNCMDNTASKFAYA